MPNRLPVLTGDGDLRPDGSSLTPRLSSLIACATLLLASCSTTSRTTSTQEASAENAPMQTRAVQPGAPGEATRILTQTELIADPGPTHTEADVLFMQGMIAHHAQALDMTELIPDRYNHPVLNLLARRIDLSQDSEIGFMQQWLRRRNEVVPDAVAYGAHGMEDGEDMLMPGMLTREQMEELASATGIEFYRLFLTCMISHHEGALVMVEELLSNDGAAQDSDIYRFSADVVTDQSIEISRMQQMLAGAR